MNYTAINIGPIYTTLSMARKPREFWQASYLFSHLMRRLIEAVVPQATLLSPYMPDKQVNMVGLFPDRAFFKSEQPVDMQGALRQGMMRFADDIGFPVATVEDYFNVMCVSLECPADREAVTLLNERLNFMELTEYAPDPATSDALQSLLMKTYDSPLFKIAFGEKRFKVETLEDIATYEMRKFNTPRKSYHDYICIVQADGDNMGKVVTHLPDGKLGDISKELMAFGEKACSLIAGYGGLPVYAGGDDLLFIAPVWGGDKAPRHIFSLLEELDGAYRPVADAVEQLRLEANDREIRTSMSYGVSVTYYKYPLYEAWKLAADQLFRRAKNAYGGGKNAIAWQILKHAGSAYIGGFSKNNVLLCDAFGQLLHTVMSETVVSAAAHKIRSSGQLLALLQQSSLRESRLHAFFTKIIDVADKDEQAIAYIEAVENLLKGLYAALDRGEVSDVASLTLEAYGMLRSAKFINGEEEKL